MTPDSPPARRAYRPLRVPAFYPVPLRTRRDGWTVPRQANCLGMLAETGSVMGACEAVGMSRKSAYRLRALPGAGSFAAAWDADGGNRTGPKPPKPRSGKIMPRVLEIAENGIGTACRGSGFRSTGNRPALARHREGRPRT